MADSQVLMGAYKDTQAAHRTVQDLVGVGVYPDHIGVLMNDRAKADFARIEKSNKSPEGAAIGGAAGIVIGALIASLTTVAAVAAPGVGLLVAGPIAAAFAGAGAGGATGGVLGALIGLGIPEHHAKFHLSILKEDGVVVVVQSRDSDELERAGRVLRQSSSKVESATGRYALL